ncbi:MAG: metal-dependent hydrolase [Candidatus Altiarchaeota archaeon]
MPGYQTHLIGYLLTALLVVSAIYHFHLIVDASIYSIIPAVAFGALYSLLPDLDTPSSRMRRVVAKLFLSVTLASLIIYLIGYGDNRLLYISLSLSSMLYILWFVKHRGILHTPVAGLILSAPLYLLAPMIAAAAFIGFISHLALDGEVLR